MSIRYRNIFSFTIAVCLLSIQAYGQCGSLSLISNFDKMCQPAAFKWVVQNAPAGSKLTWDFGKGEQKGQDTFYAFIDIAGKVSVTAKVSLPNGGECTLIETDFVEVLPIPIPQIYTSRTTLCNGPDTVSYFDISANSVKRTWSIEGKYIYNSGKTYQHSYATTGIKKLTLVVENSYGCVAIKEFDSVNYIFNKPTIDFTADIKTGCINQWVQYTPIIYDIGNANYASQWNFSGGNPAVQLKNNPDKIYYADSGSFSTSLKISTENGCQYQISKSNYLTFGLPAYLSIKFSDTSLCLGKTITIENQDKTLPGTLSFNCSGLTNINTSQAFTIIGTYQTIGKHSVNATYDHKGCISTQNFNNIIRSKGVKSEFSSLDNVHCKLPFTVHFKNLSQSYEPGSMFYQWQVLENNVPVHSSFNINDSFKVTKFGSYSVSLFTLHSNGCDDTYSKANFITAQKIVPDFSSDINFACKNQKINLIQKTATASYSSPNTYTWTFYDKDGMKILGKSTKINPDFIYSDTGLYSIKLVAKNSAGCADSITKPNVIQVIKPTINFELLNPVICKNSILLAKGNSSPAACPFSYSWYLKNLNDGKEIYAEGVNFSQALSAGGSYNFKFVHHINGGCRDSIVNNTLVNANGVNGSINLPKNSGCLPFQVKPTATILENYHFGNSDSSLKYKWSVSPNANVTVLNELTSKPEFIFTAVGTYTLLLTLENSSGCVQTISSKAIYAGVKSEFTISDTKVCNNQTVLLQNTSFPTPDHIEWLIDDGTLTKSDLHSNSLSLQFVSSGIHRIGLVAGKDHSCYDTLFKEITAIEVKANLFAEQTNLKCAPVYAKFKSISKNADWLSWNFGDGNQVITTDTSIANIYYKNSGIFDAYDLTLIAYNNEGCSDTLFKPGYMKIIGPVPNFTIETLSNCGELKTSFTNFNKNVHSFLFDYGDGSAMDTVFSPHTYTLKNPLITETFIPVIYARDEIGCLAKLESEDTITVFGLPLAQFNLNEKELCENLKVKINNTADPSLNFGFWISQNNGPYVLNPPNITELSLKAANYKIKQVVSNIHGCTDSLVENLVVNPLPKASYSLLDSLCFNKIVNFNNTSTGNNSIIGSTWHIETPTNYHLFNSPNLQFAFDFIGSANVKLTVTDLKGCESSIADVITIPDTAVNYTPNLNYVSVNEDGSIDLASSAITYKRFLFGELMSKTDQSSIAINHSKNESNFNYIPLITDTSNCFNYQITDLCGYKSSLSKTHCTIQLTIQSTVAFSNQLQWTPYLGWDAVETYRIYRRHATEQNYILMASLSGNQLSFLDTGLCNSDYVYYVEAKFNQLISQSNRVNQTPLFIYPIEFTDVKTVSVNANNSITINWNASTNPVFGTYKLTKICAQTGLQEDIYTRENTYTDLAVQSNLFAYNYFVTEYDKCGNSSKSRFGGKSMVLNASSSNYTSYLNWNSYQLFPSGVSRYKIQIEKNGAFKTLGSATDSGFVHPQDDIEIHGSYCYRIMAISGNGEDSCYSNVSCVISPSTLFFPNVFSPNGDGINETIGAKSLFVYNEKIKTGRNFHLEIYNKWGEKLFETFDLDEEWDGITKGQMNPEGNYMFQLNATGADYRNYSMKGSILIIR